VHVCACVCVRVFVWQTLVELRDKRKSSDHILLVLKSPTYSVLLALMDVITQVQLLHTVLFIANNYNNNNNLRRNLLALTELRHLFQFFFRLWISTLQYETSFV